MRAKGKPLDPRKLALRIAAAAKSKKALKPVILDMRELSSFCDYFVIAGGNSVRQVHAIADAIAEDLAKEGVRPISGNEPSDDSGWLVLDYHSVVAHIFHKPLRDFYALEDLWADARKVRITRP